MQLIAFILLAVAMYGRTAHGLSQELRDHALKLHNDYRMNVPNACQMERMQYDLELERQATVWANKCVFEHEIIKGRGENLAWNSAKDPETDLMTKAAKAWYDEVHLYSYGQYSCGSACHYTQMVWDKTNKVGCATKRCSYLTYAYADAWYFVCFYSPAGNMNGEKPYQTSCSTPCKENQVEDSDGLCIGTATGGGSTNGGTETGSGGGATKKPEPCVDKDVSSCPTWSRDGECKKNPGYMLKNCRKSCKVCVAGGGTEEESEGSGAGNNKEESCLDKNTGCPTWAGNGQCKSNPGYMLKNCRKSCQACEQCEDKDRRCPGWKRGGHCKSNPKYMNKNCKKSCQVCGGTGEEETGGGEKEKEKEPCVDKDTRCAKWAQWNQCVSNPGYMLKNCKKSCKVCAVGGENGGKNGNNKDTTSGEKEEGTQGDQGHQDKGKGCGNGQEVTKTKETKDKGSTNGNKEGKNKQGSNETCPEDKKKCRYWKKRNLCTKNPKFMKRRCKRACGLCTP